MTNKLLVAGLVIMIVLNGICLWTLWGRGGHKGHHGPPLPPRLEERIGFDDAQRKSFEVLRNEHRSGAKKYAEEIGNINLQLLSPEGLQDSILADSLIRQAGIIHAEFDRFTRKHFNGVRALCKDEEQRKQFDEALVDLVKNMSRPHPPEPGPPGHR